MSPNQLFLLQLVNNDPPPPWTLVTKHNGDESRFNFVKYHVITGHISLSSLAWRIKKGRRINLTSFYTNNAKKYIFSTMMHCDSHRRYYSPPLVTLCMWLWPDIELGIIFLALHQIAMVHLWQFTVRISKLQVGVPRSRDEIRIL